MHAAEHLILHGKLPITPQLSFNAQASLRVIRRLDVRGQTPYAWRSRRTCSAKWVREGGMANDELPGMYSVQKDAAFNRCLRQAIVEDSSSRTQNGFLVARRKRQCQARRKVVVTTLVGFIGRFGHLARCVVRFAVQLLYFLGKVRPVVAVRIREEPSLSLVVPVVRGEPLRLLEVWNCLRAVTRMVEIFSQGELYIGHQAIWTHWRQPLS